MLDAIGHIALIVKDSSRTAALFKDLFDAVTVARKDSDGHEETYVRLGRTWFVLVQAEVDRPRGGDHIAFSVLKSALYFFDYDNHVFELDTTDLERELAG